MRSQVVDMGVIGSRGTIFAIYIEVKQASQTRRECWTPPVLSLTCSCVTLTLAGFSCDNDSTTTHPQHLPTRSPACRYVKTDAIHTVVTHSRQPRETVVIEASPPAYPGGYGTIEVHHHHHTLRTRGPRGSYCKAFLVTLLILLTMTIFSVVFFVAWNFYNLSECEKKRLPWDKPCKDWLGKDSFAWGLQRLRSHRE
jgi:hypothetical protein